MVYKVTDFVSSQTEDFAKICGFKKKPFRKKFTMNGMWRDLEQYKNDIVGLKKYFKQYKCDVEECGPISIPLKPISISGFYTPETNRIEIYLATTSFNSHLFDEKSWWEFKFVIIQVFCHEVIHMMQFSNRDFFWSYRRCKFRKVRSESVNLDRKYHSNMDEIQAYAHCIFLELMEFGVGLPETKKENYKYKLSFTFNLLLKTFGYKISEPTIQKTMYYIHQWAKKYNVK